MSNSNGATSAATISEPSPAISRSNLILLAILLIQLAVSAYLLWPSAGAPVSDVPLLAGVTTDNVTALTITDGNGRSVSFIKEGGVWTLADTEGYPANSTKITETLDKLVAIAAKRLVTQTSGSHDRLQVAENNYQRKIEITTANGLQTLYLGSSTGGAATHVRAANEDATYLTNEVATWQLDTLASTWINVAYYKVPKEQITQVTLENANGTLTFVPGSDATGTEWTLADATADEPVAPANINTLIDRIATLNLHTVLGKSESPEYGLATPLATITVVTNEPISGTTNTETKTTTLLVGVKDQESNTYYFKSSDSDFYVRLAAFTGDEFVNKQRSDFMVEAEAATQDASQVPVTEPVATPLPEATDPSASATNVVTNTSELESGTSIDATAVPTTTATPTN